MNENFQCVLDRQNHLINKTKTKKTIGVLYFLPFLTVKTFLTVTCCGNIAFMPQKTHVWKNGGETHARSWCGYCG